MIAKSERRFIEALSDLIFLNPFQPRRLELEKEALGRDYQPENYLAWSKDFSRQANERPNVRRINERAAKLVDQLRTKLQSANQADEETLRLYQDLVIYVLYYRHAVQFEIEEFESGRGKWQKKVTSVWKSFHEQYHHYLSLPNHRFTDSIEPAHLFALFFQIRRAFLSIFDNILGESLPAVQLRATVWQSVFTHDMQRYRRSLYSTMRELTTLITGPSGTGKELVARAISLSQYIKFDSDKQQFVGGFTDAFTPVNLSALSPTLIESELFGHCRGAFTGALADRHGWLESCPAHGAVFLDEIGELDAAVQVKLLRVVQSGEFTRIGETKRRQFAGKLLAATHRDLSAEMHAGRFREDLYYRLCSDHITTPSLREQLDDSPAALRGLVSFIAQSLVSTEAETLTDEVESWIQQHIGADYPWPGNIRELEQCVRNVLIRREYQPRTQTASSTTQPAWLNEVASCTLSHSELLTRYCTASYAKYGSFKQTAEKLGLDRRTVRSKVDDQLLKSIKQESEH